MTNFNSRAKKIIYITTIFIFLSFFLVIFFSSLINIYDRKDQVLRKVGLGGHYYHNFLANPTVQSDRQIPPKNINDLKINNNSEINGQWSAPIDWGVTAIHSILLPDETVMTFGSYGIHKKEHGKDIRSNKKITISNGTELERDGGGVQWEGHSVNIGIDFDIWDPKKGIDDNSHTLIEQTVVMDAFCSVVRVLDDNRVFILGGNKDKTTKLPDTQNQSMIYDVKNKKFSLSKNLNFKRWYGSVVITGDEKMFIFGGIDLVTGIPSTVPEMIDLKNIDQGWRVLDQSESNDLFGNKDSDEWNYPRTFLSSDGNIVGISYNKTWVMDLDNDNRVSKTGEIPLAKSGIPKVLEPVNPKSDHDHDKQNLKLLTIGSPVGSQNSVVMFEKDKVLVLGGKQVGEEYSSSNKVFLIDFSNSFKPKIKELKSMNFARADGDATILPDGNIFINGGQSYNEQYSVFTPEIYNPITQTTRNMSKSYFRRNYHSTSLLLPDGRILTAGGDVWNAEIFYPPYLFAKDKNNKTVLAKRPEITSLEKNIKRDQNINISVKGEVSKVSLVSAGSTTHAQGSESKFRDIDFTKLSNDKIQIKLDNNSNNLQNGTYLLFVLNSKGTPSEGKIVFIN